MWDAITSSDADAIADPIYKISQQLTTTTVEVSGFKANFKDIRIATKQDLIDYISLLISTNGIQSISYQMFKVYFQEKEIQSEIPEEKRLTDEEIEELWEELSLNGSNTRSSPISNEPKSADVTVNQSGGQLPYSGKKGKQIWKQDIKPLPLLKRANYVSRLHPKDRKGYNRFVLGRTVVTVLLVTLPLSLLVAL